MIFFLQLSEAPALPWGLNPANNYDSSQFWSLMMKSSQDSQYTHANKYSSSIKFCGDFHLLVCFSLGFLLTFWTLLLALLRSLKISPVDLENWDFQSRFSTCLQDPKAWLTTTSCSSKKNIIFCWSVLQTLCLQIYYFLLQLIIHILSKDFSKAADLYRLELPRMEKNTKHLNTKFLPLSGYIVMFP